MPCKTCAHVHLHIPNGALASTTELSKPAKDGRHISEAEERAENVRKCHALKIAENVRKCHALKIAENVRK
jgi:galactose-1-phosphate uridylyltransferase